MELVSTESFENLFREHHRFRLIQPVRMHEIRTYVDDLKYALGQSGVNIVAPVPGQQAIEINFKKKNWKKQKVDWKDLLRTEEYMQAGPLVAPIGLNDKGEVQLIDFKRVQHLLVLGTDVSDRTMFLNSLLCSLIAESSPKDVQFLLIDPAVSEFAAFTKAPHLVIEPVSDIKQSVFSLRWMEREIERRYTQLQTAKVRDMEEFNDMLAPHEKKKKSMSRIFVVIHEMADLVTFERADIGSALSKMLMLSRAVGVHFICGTGSYESQVLRPVMLASIPLRVIFPSVPDTMQDTIYGCKLEDVSTYGDLHLKSEDMESPLGVTQGKIALTEVATIVKAAKDAHVSAKASADTPQLKQASTMIANLFDDDDDDLYEAAKSAVIKAGKASTSHIQRVLKVGYSRAARLMDLLEKRGVIGPADGSSPRDVLE